ncbi:hypothetical protein BMAPRL20_0154 [Burkholderia mallei PRL-20]|uniref:Uncharacterized protein n=1 Tax=Burkholderia pseudomallei (strain 1106a) TaxID=357348 RepID=A3P8G1_BURP0|nr:hypothetical protein BURPS668_A2734 [Burkholderia pseudomallei 668]ABN93813.1 hypothetical protein BURPS1106A_A2591 [Burkholderia pseudomallei 1106a]ABO03520.1 hypothetical protein BMA10247_A0206 [Burkholderia mallei NCTC 10247]EEC34695.1 conserved hypothetical protein [Burkholderia pseudomallei 576]EEP86146.1 conserved hypothetical protein [Burkholderia mallei GB8 horse 4]EES22502.1 hypothetical protein BURPS1106B_2585 [Burkholderia pseudomallei 1106b]EES45593.1 hypothetical protein BMAPR
MARMRARRTERRRTAAFGTPAKQRTIGISLNARHARKGSAIGNSSARFFQHP